MFDGVCSKYVLSTICDESVDILPRDSFEAYPRLCQSPLCFVQDVCEPPGFVQIRLAPETCQVVGTTCKQDCERQGSSPASIECRLHLALKNADSIGFYFPRQIVRSGRLLPSP